MCGWCTVPNLQQGEIEFHAELAMYSVNIYCSGTHRKIEKYFTLQYYELDLGQVYSVVPFILI